ncbi:MAG: hypothetical protein ACFFEY_17955 [Candidatus Thorarchaeota archaeon]
MSISIELICTYIILIPFIIGNISLVIASFFQKKITLFIKSSLKLEDKFKDSKVKIFNITNTIVWIAVGLVFALNLDIIISLSALIVFLAFRGGFTLSKRFIFGICDVVIAKSNCSNKKLRNVIYREISIGIIFVLLFVLMWGILYRYINVAVRSIFGIETNLLLIILWVGGFFYGLISSLIVSIVSINLLLKNEINNMLLFSGVVLREKIKIKKITS